MAPSLSDAPAARASALMVFASLAILAAAGVIVFARPEPAPTLGRRRLRRRRCARHPAQGLHPARPGRAAASRCAGYRGQVVVLTFMYSTCQDTCPVTATHDPRRARRPRPRRARAGGQRRPGPRHARLGRGVPGQARASARGACASCSARAPSSRRSGSDYGIQPAGQRLRALRLRAAHRQARAPAHQLPGRAARRPRPGPRHPQARATSAPRGRCRRRRVVLAAASRRRSRRSWTQSTTTTMSTGAR